MPAVSEKQRRAMGMALALKRGELKTPAGPAVQSMAKMTETQLKDFARTPDPHHRHPMRYLRRGEI